MNLIIRRLFSSCWKAGDFVEVTKTLTQKDLDGFSEVTGDHNPIHSSKESQVPIVHGALLNGIMSGIIGTKIPGPGTLVISQTLNFPSKCFLNEPINFRVELLEVRKLIKIKYQSTQNGVVVFHGEAKLLLNDKTRK
jgi:acyl dehydratase